MYLVIWEINIEADTPEDAAKEALRIQRNPESIATVFRVIADNGQGSEKTVDLETM